MPDPKVPDAAPDPEPPRRRVPTVLGRLGVALRRQDWGIVFMELAVVVIGVVMGFQVTAWGQARSDHAKEQAYLRQLAADLRETERRFAEAEERVAFADEGRTRLLHAFWTPDTSPSDSVLYWANVAAFYIDPRSVQGTVTALLSTGDLNLIRDDSMRSAITTFAEAEARYAELNRDNVQIILANSRRIWERLDILEGTYNLQTPAWMDSVAEATGVQWFPPGTEHSAFVNDVPAFLRDRENYGMVMSMFDAGGDMLRSRRARVEEVRALRASVEAALGR